MKERKMYPENLSGLKFGRLTVLFLDHIDDKGNQIWKCECSCDQHNIINVNRKYLINGITRSCGCLVKEARKVPNSGQFKPSIDPTDIIGKRFGKLTILSIDDTHQGNHYYYNCKCDCGNIISKRRNSILDAKETPSCGCYKIEKASSDIIGKTFNQLTVLSFDHYENKPDGRKKYYFKCRCTCGNECVVEKLSLVNNATKSCGCRHTSMMGMSETKFYRIYNAMKDRCYNINNIYYKNYGGRGIIVCDRWLDPINGFKNFKEDMYDTYLEHVRVNGESNTTIERIDVNKNYCKENCTWATYKEQANNKTSNHYVFYNNETLTLMQCVEKYADCRLTYDAVKRRIYSGWDLDRALHELPNADRVQSPIIFINKDGTN